MASYIKAIGMNDDQGKETKGNVFGNVLCTYEHVHNGKKKKKIQRLILFIFYSNFRQMVKMVFDFTGF